ncbi:MAG: RCC1 domain-containing protein [Nanopusillaceae archaeon]
MKRAVSLLILVIILVVAVVVGIVLYMSFSGKQTTTTNQKSQNLTTATNQVMQNQNITQSQQTVTNFQVKQKSIIAAGAAHTCALLSDGSIKCWGDNYDGQLGDGTNITRYTPVTVQGISNAVAIAAGAFHTCAVLSDGTVKCWGDNYYGQLGDGTDVTRYTPVTVQGISNAVAIAAGYSHTCALLSDGTVKCWGDNEGGQLGDNGKAFSFSYTPVTVQNLSNVVAIAAGWDHTCAVLSDGTVKCWGDNEGGQLGDGTNITRYTPVTVVDLRVFK